MVLLYQAELPGRHTRRGTTSVFRLFFFLIPQKIPITFCQIVFTVPCKGQPDYCDQQAFPLELMAEKLKREQNLLLFLLSRIKSGVKCLLCTLCKIQSLQKFARCEKKYTVYKLKKHPTTKIKRTLTYTEKDGDCTMVACSRRSDSGERCKVKGSAKK